MKSLILTEKDIYELIDKAEKSKKNLTDLDMLTLEQNYRKLNPLQFKEEEKVAKIIRINDRTVVAPVVSEKQATMIEYCGIVLDQTTRSFARKDGWSDKDLLQPKNLASKEYMDIAFRAVANYPFCSVFTARTEFLDSDSLEYGVPVADCMLDIASKVAADIGNPFKEVLSKLTGEKEVKEDVKKILDNCWGENSELKGETIFDISPVWSHNGGLAWSYGFSGSNYKDKSWKKFLVSKAHKTNQYYSAAFGVAYRESMWENGDWARLIKEKLSKSNPDWKGLLDAVDFSF